jgi:hypothetical protein
MAEKKVIELEVKTNAKSLKAQLREAQQEVQTLSDKFGITSKEATEAARKAAELKDAIGDAKALTDAFNPDAKFNALSTSISGVLNGFQAFEGALGLVGVEGEAVQKTLLKVQSAMALSQGLQGLGEARDSFKQLGAVLKNSAAAQGLLTAAQTLYTTVVGTTTGALKLLKLALVTTGIGAIVIGIGLLISKISEWSNWTDRAKEKQDKLNESLDAHQVSLRKDREELKKDLDFKIKLAEAEGKSGAELLKLKESNSKKTNAQIYSEIESARVRLKALRDADLGVMASSREEYDELVKKNIAKRKIIVQEIKDLKGEIKAGNQELLIEKTAFETESTKIVEKGEKGKTKVVDEEANKRRAKLEQDRIDLINQEQDDIVRGILADNAEVEADRLAKANKLKAEEEFIGLLVELDDQAREEKKIKDAKDLEDSKSLADTKWKLVRESLNVIGDLATAFAGKSEKEQKRAFEIQKAANIAGATMDTFKAANGAYASLATIPVVGPGLGIAAAALAIGAGLANVKNISSQQFGGGVRAVGASPSGGASGGNNNQVITPNFNIIGSQNQTQLAQLNQAPIKAYVVGSDVTTQQMLDKKKIQNATL